MTYVLRNYQAEAAQSGAQFLMGKRKNWNGIIVAPTGSGKSLIIAAIVALLDGPCIVFQPTKEILEQNLAKFQSYGYEPSIYSASKGSREIGEITLATIGSVKKMAEAFEGIRYIIIDECHLVNAEQGMYKKFIKELGALERVKVLGLTATPYRLASSGQGSQLRFITRTVPRIFNNLTYWIQNSELFDQGFLCRPNYYQLDAGFDSSKVQINSTGNEYNQDSLQLHLWESPFKTKLGEIVNRLLVASRKNILVFTQFIWQAEHLAAEIPGVYVVTGETPKDERESILNRFRSGVIKVVVNVNVLSIGFDFPELETVVLAAPSLSLTRYYQRIGRLLRPHPDKKNAYVVDLVGTYGLFGKIEDLTLRCKGDKQWYLTGRPGGKGPEQQLTNVTFHRGGEGVKVCKKCGSEDVFFMRHIETKAVATLSRPVFGVKPVLALVKEDGKRYYQHVGKDHPDAEFVVHWAVCKILSSKRGN